MTKPMKITHEIATKVFQVVDAPLADKQELCKAIDKSDIEAICDIDPINDIFSDCHDWRDEVMAELKAA